MSSKMGSKTGPCTGKKFLVTGGARGIGRALVAELYSQGATVYALARNPDGLKALKEEFPGVNTIAVDISDWDATGKALENLEPMDCLINNAAVSIHATFWEINQDNFDTMYKTNLKSVVNVSQVVAKKMIEKGGGAIVNVSSVAGKKPFQDVIAYGCLKSALEMLTKGMALELAPHKITVNSVCPAWVDTDMLRGLREGAPYSEDVMTEFMRKKTPTREAFMPMSDVINTILFFGSNITSQITGESLLVDGGLKISF